MAYTAAFVIAGAIVAFNVIRPITVLPRIVPGPGYIFTNQDGAVVTSEDARGRLTLYSLTHADCQAPTCAQSIDQISELQRGIADRIPADTPLAFLTISVDPTGDTPTDLSALADDIPGPFAWDLVTGDAARTKQVIGRGFGVYYSEPEIDATGRRQVTFDPRYVLVDGWGIIRAEYRTATPDPDLLERDINYLLSEARNSKGIARLGYEAAHLFSCYPR
jgi:protein SCO1/2